MHNIGIIATLVVFLYSCSERRASVDKMEGISKHTLDETELERLGEVTDSTFAELGLVSITDVDSTILVDLKYATRDNFMRQVLYDTIQKAYLQMEVAERLSRCQKFLDSLRPGYRLLVFDAIRPLNVQREMWEALDTVPYAMRGKFVSNPALGSVHNFGAAVDVTICDEKGNQLDMGAGYDDFRPIAFPSKEAYFLESGELSNQQYQNRILLRKVMRSQKFSNIPSEWWHFNAFSRISAEYRYPMLLSESGTWERSGRIADFVSKKDSTDSLP